MQLGAANYKWMVFIHYRRPSRKVSLLSNTMLIWVWLSKVIKLLWMKRFLERVVSPSPLHSLHGSSGWRASGPFPAPLFALLWSVPACFTSGQITVLTATANAWHTPTLPLSLFICFFSNYLHVNPSLFFYLHVGNTPHHHPDFVCASLNVPG